MDRPRGRNGHGVGPGRWGTALEGDQGRSHTANCPVCPDARAWPQDDLEQPHEGPVKITSCSCHGHRATMRYGGLPVTLPAMADDSKGALGGEGWVRTPVAGTELGLRLIKSVSHLTTLVWGDL